MKLKILLFLLFLLVIIFWYLASNSNDVKRAVNRISNNVQKEVNSYKKNQEKTKDAELKASDPEKWKQAQLVHVAKQAYLVETLLHVFKGKYNVLPGDMSKKKVKAFGFTLDYKRDEKLRGNGKIEPHESDDAWKHLKEANLIRDVPSTKLDNIGFSLVYYTYKGRSGHAVLIGSKSSSGIYDGGGFTVKDAVFTSQQRGAIMINGHGSNDCIKDMKINNESNDKSCALLIWVDGI